MSTDYQDESTERAGEPDTLRIRNKALRKGFTLIPNHVLRARSISRDSRLLYGILLSYAWQTDRCFPGYETLCADLGCGRNQLSRAIQELKREGYITVQRRGQGKTSIYTIEDGPDEIQKYQSDTSGSTTPIRQAVSPRYSNKDSVEKDSVEKDSDSISKREISLSKFRKGTATDFSSGRTGDHGEIPPAPQATSFASVATVLGVAPYPTGSEPSGATAAGTAPPAPRPARTPRHRVTKAADEAQPTGLAQPLTTAEETVLSHAEKPENRPNPSPVGISTALAAPASDARELVAAYIPDFAAEFHDQASRKASITRALHLLSESGYPQKRWSEKLYEARSLTRERSAAIGYQGKGNARSSSAGPVNKMPYYFETLTCVLGLHDHPAGQHPLPLSPAEYTRRQSSGGTSGKRPAKVPPAPSQTPADQEHAPERKSLAGSFAHLVHR